MIWWLIDLLYTLFWGNNNANQWNKIFSDIIEISSIIFHFLSTILLTIYLIFHSKNIRFSDWMIDIMIGHRLGSKYEKWSIFIVKSKWFINTNENESTDSLMEFTDDEYISDDQAINYDD